MRADAEHYHSAVRVNMGEANGDGPSDPGGSAYFISLEADETTPLTMPQTSRRSSAATLITAT
jgi:hypothetical protein